MSASTGKIGFGVLLKRGDGGGPETFTPIGELIGTITGPGFKLDVHETSHTQSPGGYKERLAGMKDAGEISLECNFLLDGTQNLAAGILKDFDAGTKRNFQLAWPTPTPVVASFTALVSEFHPKVPVNGVMTVSIKLTLSGPVTFA